MLDWIATATGASAARRAGHIQTLWGGYGEIIRIELDGGVAPTVVVKNVRPPPRATGTVSDRRKRQSYDVETAFYRDLAPRCDDTCRVARLYASRVTAEGWLLVLEDLDAAGFSERADDASRPQLDACLRWLASFHARFIGEPSAQLGTYWHLATRIDELPAIADPGLRDAAPELDALLSAARFQTILHGDPKEANFCFTRDGRGVAAVDFQYTGRGCAMKDVAYLLHGRRDHATTHLDTYFRHLGADPAVEAEWRQLYPVAVRDFQRFLAGWRPGG